MANLTKREIIKMQIKRIEKEIRDTPYHKGTEHHIGRLRAKLSKLKDQEMGAGPKKGGGAGGYAVKKQGDATIVLVGPPSAGKSTLLNALTNAESKVAPYAFTTVSVIPGMMNYHDAYIQILDVPGLIEGAEEGKGRGREVLSVVRGADLLVLFTDIKRPEAIQRIKDALERNGIRVDKSPPEVLVEKKLKGGMIVKSNIKQDFDLSTVKEIAKEMGIINAEIQIREKINLEQLIDVFAKNRVYIPSITVLNKADTSKKRPLRNAIYISAEKQENFENLRQEIWKKLNLVRIYLIKRDEEPNENNPMIVNSNYTLKQLSEKIGEDFAENKTKAKIWGPGSRFPAQTVSLNTKAVEGMQIRFI